MLFCDSHVQHFFIIQFYFISTYFYLFSVFYFLNFKSLCRKRSNIFQCGSYCSKITFRVYLYRQLFASVHSMHSTPEMSGVDSRKWLACQHKIIKLYSAWHSGACTEKWLAYNGRRLHKRMYVIVTSTVDETRLNGLNQLGGGAAHRGNYSPKTPIFILHNLGVAFRSIRRISGVEFTWNAPWVIWSFTNDFWYVKKTKEHKHWEQPGNYLL